MTSVENIRKVKYIWKTFYDSTSVGIPSGELYVWWKISISLSHLDYSFKRIVFINYKHKTIFVLIKNYKS